MGQHLHIRAHLPSKRDKNQAVDDAVEMLGDEQDRPGARHLVELRRRIADIQLQEVDGSNEEISTDAIPASIISLLVLRN